jgi:hypothetical protein
MAKPNQNNGMGVTSMVLGICSIIIPLFGIICGILAIIFSVKQNKIEKTGMSTAGMVTGIIGLVFNFLMLPFWIIMWIAMSVAIAAA